MLGKLKEIILKIYHVIWHDICHLPQPFTYYLRRFTKKYPWFWMALSSGIAWGIAWLLLHLGGFV